VLDLCVDQLEALGWGEPSGEVRTIASWLLLDAISQDLRDRGHERLANPLGWNRPDAHRVPAPGRGL
jgi:hypothetical protein